MRGKLTALFYIIIFSGLGLFSFLLLVNYSDLTAITDAVSSAGALVFCIAVFNLLGFSTLRLSEIITYASSRWKIMMVYSSVALVLFLLNYGVMVAAKLLVGSAHPFYFQASGIRLLFVVWLVELVVLGLMVANRFAQNALKLQKERSALQVENDTARYTALQNQLNPHFLFNTLNTLIAEIEYDPKNAVIFTRNLSDVYRYVLQCQNRPLVSLGEELEFMRSYLFLHSVRLGDCIHCSTAIAADCNENQLPPLTLQLLVENVIKHNSITTNRPMDISISITDNYLVVSNPVNPKKGNEPSGVGLQNLMNRCRLIMGREMIVEQSVDSFTVKVPMIYE